MRVRASGAQTLTVGIVVAAFTATSLSGAAQDAPLRPGGCWDPTLAAAQTCADSGARRTAPMQPLPAGDAPEFLRAFVQPLVAPVAWQRIYHEVEQCAGASGDYARVRWAVMNAPLSGEKGLTYAFTIRDRIVLVRNDTTYLRHEMLHHILQVSGWTPRSLGKGEQYSIADLHPQPPFGRCTGGH
jgi:hypothetical protein